MTLGKRPRWLILSGLLIATLAAAIWVPEGQQRADEILVAAAEPGSRSMPQSTASEPPRLNLDKLRIRSLGKPRKDPFAGPPPKVPKKLKTTARPAPVAARAAPVPKATAPPLPFVFLGKISKGGQSTAYLIRGKRSQAVREGEVIDSLYRVESVTHDKITFVYLPLEQRQTLAIGKRR